MIPTQTTETQHSLTERAKAAFADEREQEAEALREQDERAQDDARKHLLRWTLTEGARYNVKGFLPDDIEVCVVCLEGKPAHYNAQTIVDEMIFCATEHGLFIIDTCPSCEGEVWCGVSSLVDVGRWLEGDRSGTYHRCPGRRELPAERSSRMLAEKEAEAVQNGERTWPVSTETTPEGMLLEAVRRIAREVVAEMGS
jgi:hypothetical protein